jgi:DNA-binding NtrC family response regulator
LDHTVFVVDDDESARKSLTFLLRTDGLRSRAFGSAPAFLEQLTADQRGCVVTDVRMPQMDGIALFRRLRELDCRMPVIVITGHAEVPMAVQAMKAGACDFIEKPFESEVILQAVRRCLEKSRSLCTVDAGVHGSGGGQVEQGRGARAEDQPPNSRGPQIQDDEQDAGRVSVRPGADETDSRHRLIVGKKRPE